MSILTLSLWAVAGPHADHVAEFGHLRAPPRPAAARPPPAPPPSFGPDMKVYGYLAYWSDDLTTLRWDELSHIAIFSAGATATGGLTDTSRWDIADDAVAMAAPYGVRVHLCVTNFSGSDQRTLLANPTYRSNLIDALVDWKNDTGAHGINVDFEGLPADARDDMLTFVQELEAAVGEVVLATPAVDWSGAWDYSELSKHADLFIMGYDYFWSGSSYAGPSDPLDAGSGTVWSGVNGYSIMWTLDDYLYYDADPERVILGLPLYGRSWSTANDAVPTATLGTGSTLLFADGWDIGAAYGVTYEPDSAALHSFDGSRQYWYGDVATVQERIAYARDVAQVSGIGFWALHYDDDDPAMWDMIRDETTWTVVTDPEPTDTGTAPEPTDPTDPEPTGDDDDDDGSRGDDDDDGAVDDDTTLRDPPLGTAELVGEPKAGCGCAGAAGSGFGGGAWLLAAAIATRRRGRGARSRQ